MDNNGLATMNQRIAPDPTVQKELCRIALEKAGDASPIIDLGKQGKDNSLSTTAFRDMLMVQDEPMV